MVKEGKTDRPSNDILPNILFLCEKVLNTAFIIVCHYPDGFAENKTSIC